jgi:hypothetical protein
MPRDEGDPGSLPGIREDDLRREALRLCDRYIDEVVLAFGLCPWAEPSLRAGTVARHVLTGPRPVPADCLPVIDEWEAGPAGGAGPVGGKSAAVAVGLLVIPRFTGSRAAFDTFAEGVRRADRSRRAAGAAPPFLVAAFHPVGASRFAGPHQLVSFLRRSPDPLLQLVRADLLDGVRAASVDVSGEIAARNHAAITATPEVAARFAAVIRALHADRADSYATLGL